MALSEDDEFVDVDDEDLLVAVSQSNLPTQPSHLPHISLTSDRPSKRRIVSNRRVHRDRDITSNSYDGMECRIANLLGCN
jgi:hypothetical protein